jgi:hypothetical protein
MQDEPRFCSMSQIRVGEHLPHKHPSISLWVTTYGCLPPMTRSERSFRKECSSPHRPPRRGPALSMELESVDNVVVNILSRHDCCCLPVSDLFVLCTRVYGEHLLPQLGLGAQHLPAELHALDSFVDFLRTWDSSNLVLIGEGSNCMAQLCVPLQQSDDPDAQNAACVPGQTVRSGGFAPFDTPDPSENSGGSSTHPFYDPDGDSWGVAKQRNGQKRELYSTPDERVTFIRQLLCRCVFDYVLKESSAHAFTSAMSLEDARKTCIHYLVRPRLLQETLTLRCSHAPLVVLCHLPAFATI